MFKPWRPSVRSGCGMEGAALAGGTLRFAPVFTPSAAQRLSAVAIALLLGIAAFSVLVAIAPRVSAYTPHPPIRIDGDGNFTPANGITGGAGTPADPYVIEGWEINASTWHGIDIRDTHAAFIIRGNYVHSGGSNFAGVYLARVSNGSVRDNAITDNEFGIRFDDSRNLLIAGNNLSDDGDAIYLARSADSILTANRITSSKGYGVLVTDSDNVTIASNTLSNDASGIGLAWTTNMTLRANHLTSEGIYIDDQSSPGSVRYFNTHTISPDNLVNGKPLYYHKDCADLSADSLPVGELIVVNCKGVRVSNLDIADTDLGIEMAFVTDATLTANRLTGNDIGVWIRSSRDVVLSDNNATRNGHGFWLRDMTGVTLLDNNLSQNGGGVSLDSSENAALLANRMVSNSAPGITLGPGVANVQMVGNILSDNEWGVYVNGASSNLTLIANDVSANRAGGIDFGSTTKITLTGNRVARNGNFGIVVGYGADTLITDNTIANNGYGIYLYGRPMGPTGVLVHHNRIMANRAQGFDDQGPENVWDDDYPSGGNWWSDYGGVDRCSGPNQDICPSPDGIGDTPYVLDGDSRDRFPLMQPPPPRNAPPVAVLSVDPDVLAPGQPAVVTANGSFDPDGTITAYTFTFGDGASTGDVPTPFGPHAWTAPGTYLVEVVVTDNQGATSRASARVSVVTDLPPHAVAKVSPDPPWNLGTTFTFDGTASWDAEGPIAAYLWEFGDGTKATGSTTTHRYAARGTFDVTLTASDLAGQNDTVLTDVRVLNRAPIADAGADKTAFRNARVTLNGLVSRDPDGDPLEYTWTRLAGPSVALADETTRSPTFTPAAPGLYSFRLTVRDGWGGSSNDTVNVAVPNRSPIANAGPDGTAREGTAVALDGTGSSDPDGDALSYAWTRVGGPFVALSGPDTAAVTFTSTETGVYTFELTVADGFGGIANDTVTVFVAQGTLEDPVVITFLGLTLIVLATVPALLVFFVWRRRRRRRDDP